MRPPVDLNLTTERLSLCALSQKALMSVRGAFLAQRERIASAFARTLLAIEEKPAEFLRVSQHEWIEGSLFRFTVWDTNGFVGMVILRELDWAKQTAELSYLLLEQAEGKGYAYEAAGAVVDWAETELSLSLWLRIVPGNVRSERLAARLGFRLDTGKGDDYIDTVGVVHPTARYVREAPLTRRPLLRDRVLP